jgi:DNA-binding GntR family transcriptional regulator
MSRGAGQSLRRALAVDDSRERTLADRAYSTLHDAIVRGRLAPGERLPIEELAGSLNMSPMPVREALRRLDAVGLVEHVPHRGATVTELSMEDLVNVYEARLALEPLAVGHAAERITPEGAADARAAFAALARLSPRSPKLWETHSRFHFSLYRAAGSRWLLRLITPLWESSERYRTASKIDPALMRQSEHEAILETVIDGDAERARALMYNHLAVTANYQAQQLSGEELFELVAIPASKREDR